MNPYRILFCLITVLAGGSAMSTERMLIKEVTIRASLDDVWHAWTTEDGLRFISRESNVELRRGGPYEWFIAGSADENGKRGGEGAQILAYLPKEMIAFSWTFPPDVPELRNASQTTQVVVKLNDQGDGTVHVRLTAHEWQDGEAWDAGFRYFDQAWAYVLASLKKHLETESVA